jgi:hypothetical protein
MVQDPARILGVPWDAQIDDIKKAYRKLVLECHPDRHFSGTEASKMAAAARFKAISDAYDVLTNGEEDVVKCFIIRDCDDVHVDTCRVKTGCIQGHAPDRGQVASRKLLQEQQQIPECEPRLRKKFL